jgi:hypothetical protein
MPEIGEAYVRIAARDADLTAGLARAEQKTFAFAERTQTIANSAMVNMGDAVRGTIGKIGMLREEQGKTAASMAEMGYIGRRELILLSSQFGATGVAAHRMFLLIQSQSATAAAAIAKIGPAIILAGIAFTGWEIGRGLRSALGMKGAGWFGMETEAEKEQSKTLKGIERSKAEMKPLVALSNERSDAARRLTREQDKDVTNTGEVLKLKKEIQENEKKYASLGDASLAVRYAIEDVEKRITEEKKKQAEKEKEIADAALEDLRRRDRWAAINKGIKEDVIKMHWDRREAEHNASVQALGDAEELKKAQMDELTEYLHKSQEGIKSDLSDKMEANEKEQRMLRRTHDDKMRLLEDERRRRESLRFEIFTEPKALWEAAAKAGISTRDLEEKRFTLERQLEDAIRRLTDELEKNREQERQLNKIPF